MNWDRAGQLDLLQIVPVFIAPTVSIIIINIIRIGRGRERVVIRLLDSYIAHTTNTTDDDNDVGEGDIDGVMW